MQKSILFEELSLEELQNIVKTSGTIYLPLGTLEWHSKHLPFGLDALVSYEICKQSCNISGGCVIPPVYFGTDREHRVGDKIFHGMDAQAKSILPGSIYYLKKNLFFKFLKQIVSNIQERGFRKLVIVSAHSGPGQQMILEKLAKEKFDGLEILIFPGKLFKGGIDHAGRIETSLMLAINKNLVHLSKLKGETGPIRGKNPALASVKEGKKRINDIVKQITTAVMK